LSIRSSFIVMPTNWRPRHPQNSGHQAASSELSCVVLPVNLVWQPNQGLFTQKQPTGGNFRQSGSRTGTLSHGPSASLCPSILNLSSNPSPPFGEITTKGINLNNPFNSACNLCQLENISLISSGMQGGTLMTMVQIMKGLQTRKLTGVNL